MRPSRHSFRTPSGDLNQCRSENTGFGSVLLSLDLLWGAACICAARFFHGRAHASVARIQVRVAGAAQP